MATQNLTHAQDMLDRLSEQFKGKPNIAAVLNVSGVQYQELEDVFFAVLTERSIDTAIGAQLDVIGSIVDQPRDGATDDEYRRRIRARIATLNSEGTTEDLLKIAPLVIDDVAATFVVEFQPPASVAFKVENSVPTVDTVSALFGFLKDAVSGGVRILLHTLTDTEAETFTFATAAFLAGLEGAGSTALVLSSPAPDDWPDSGSIDLDLALAVAETVAYTQISNDRLTITCASTASAHTALAAVQLNGTPGKGYDDFDTPGGGGKFSNVTSN